MAKHQRLRVYVDASYRDGRAALAMTGALGLHTRCVPAVSSTHAETLVLDWVFETACNRKLPAMQVRTDCHGAIRKSQFMMPHGYDYDVVWVPRSKNVEAHFHAKKALNQMVRPVIWAEDTLATYTWPC